MQNPHPAARSVLLKSAYGQHHSVIEYGYEYCPGCRTRTLYYDCGCKTVTEFDCRGDQVEQNETKCEECETLSLM